MMRQSTIVMTVIVVIVMVVNIMMKMLKAGQSVKYAANTNQLMTNPLGIEIVH